MFKYDSKQQVIDLNGVKVGGQPGENPTLAIASIFYPKHSLVTDAEKGFFDEARARQLVETLRKASAETHIPIAIDVYAKTCEAGERFIDFCADFDIPLFLDSSDALVRSRLAEYAREKGLAEKCVYNSLNAGSTPQEFASLKQSGLDKGVLLGFNPMKQTAQARLDVYENGAGVLPQGLLSLASDAGISGVFFDPGIVLFGEGAGTAVRCFTLLKAKYGFPVGGAIHNAINAWGWLKDKEFRRECDYASNLIPALLADFVFFGPIEYCAKVLPIIALGNIITAEIGEVENGVTPGKNHPINYLK